MDTTNITLSFSNEEVLNKLIETITPQFKEELKQQLLSEVKEEVEKIKANILKEAKDEASEIISDARKEANTLLIKANNLANEIVGRANIKVSIKNKLSADTCPECKTNMLKMITEGLLHDEFYSKTYIEDAQSKVNLAHSYYCDRRNDTIIGQDKNLISAVSYITDICCTYTGLNQQELNYVTVGVKLLDMIFGVKHAVDDAISLYNSGKNSSNARLTLDNPEYIRQIKFYKGPRKLSDIASSCIYFNS